MKEKNILRTSILVYWTFFWGLSVLDKMIPAVQMSWVGKDFFTLFVKLFESLGIKDPQYATWGLLFISAIEVLNFVFFFVAILQYFFRSYEASKPWMNSGIISSLLLFILFSLGDNAFGDRFQLLEHGLFWMILIFSWLTFSYFSSKRNNLIAWSNLPLKYWILILGLVLTVLTSISIVQFTKATYSNTQTPVQGEQVAEGVYKFDMPFLADRDVLELTINQFKKDHPNLKINNIYTGASELNSKKKTHVLIYLFTE